MKFKIFLLNSLHDRETTGFTSATDYIQAIITACHDSLSASGDDPAEGESWTQYVTHLVYLRGCRISVDPSELKKRGIECVRIWPGRDGMVYESNALERVLTGICSGRGGGLQRRATVQNWPIR
jgi:hypothetical protein